MIRSMTAFARREAQSEQGELVWELRSVNHRYLEAAFRLPEEFRALEPQLREKVQARLSRGKFDAVLRCQFTAAANQLKINPSLVEAVLEACARIESSIHNPARMTGMDVLRWPGVVQPAEIDTAPLQAAALTSFDKTLDELVAARESEGASLKQLLLKRRRALSKIVADIRERRPQVVAAMRDKARARLSELPVEQEPERLEQALAQLAQKLDIDEELDRLDTHLDALREALDQKVPVGRRLDFLMQEFNREANTLSAKSADAETSQTTIELKVLIEQLREQVQNVE